MQALEDFDNSTDKVYNPVTRQWINKGGSVHRRLIAGGLMPNTIPANAPPPTTTRGNFMREVCNLKNTIEQKLATTSDPAEQKVLRELMQDFSAGIVSKHHENTGTRRGVCPPATRVAPPASQPVAIPRRRPPAEDTEDDIDRPKPPARRTKQTTTANPAVKTAAKKLLAKRIEEIMAKHETEFSELDASEVEDRINKYLAE